MIDLNDKRNRSTFHRWSVINRHQGADGRWHLVEQCDLCDLLVGDRWRTRGLAPCARLRQPHTEPIVWASIRPQLSQRGRWRL